VKVTTVGETASAGERRRILLEDELESDARPTFSGASGATMVT
jgi:hypothetical protein